MKNRAASDSIKGYLYQFDKTILSILTSSPTSTITVEGLEDIDIENLHNTTSIQCKYLESKKPTNSVLRIPIQYMLDHYVKTNKKWFYYLYAYFLNDDAQKEPIDLQRLKEILTYKEGNQEIIYYEKFNISNKVLSGFLTNFKFEIGQSYYVQQKKVMEKLKNEFSCSDLDVEEIYYNKALRYISDLAITKSEMKRKTTKKKLIEYLNCKEILFNRWFYELKGKENYIKFVKKWIHNSSALRSQKEKTIFIDGKYLIQRKHYLKIEQFIANIIDKYYILNRSLRDTRPWTVILDIDLPKIREVKKQLVNMKIKFNDGHENLIFSKDFFNEKPVINTKVGTDKIISSSYYIKIISSATYIKYNNDISSEDVVFFCSDTSPDKFFSKNTTLFQLHVDSLNELNNILIAS